MPPLPEYVMQLRNDVRLLRLDKDRLTRFHQHQKEKAERLEKQLQEQAKRLKEQAKRIKELEQENEQLKQEREQSSKTTRRYQVALFDHGNLRRRKSETQKKKGGQPGHADTNRERHPSSAPEEIRRLFAPQCGICGQSLSRVQATRRKPLMDIELHPRVHTVLLERERQWGGHCKQEVCAQDPQSLPFTEYGLNTFLRVMILRFRAHASLAKIASGLEISHGLPLAPSTISNLLTQAKGYLQHRYEQLKDAVRAGHVIYADETSWLVHGQAAWMWLMANEEVTVYLAAESRGGGIARELYGNSQAFCMHDGYAAYTAALAEAKHLYCWAHLLRLAHEETMVDPDDSPAAQVRKELVRIYHLGRELALSGGPDAEAPVRTALEQVLAVPATSRSIQNIHTRLRTQKEGLIRALLCTPDGTNNLAEREIRSMVLLRKSSNGSNTFAGMDTCAVVGSVVQTAVKQGTSVLSSLQHVLQQGVSEHAFQFLQPSSLASP